MFLENQSKFSVMIIKSSCKTIKKFIEFLYDNSGYIDLYYGGFYYTKNFEDILLELLANCDEIEKVDYSKFIVYIMLSKFCPSKSLRPEVIFSTRLKRNYLENLIESLTYYRKCIWNTSVSTCDLRISSSYCIIIENNLIAHICLNIIVQQERKYRPQKALANGIAYYLCLLF